MIVLIECFFFCFDCCSDCSWSILHARDRYTRDAVYMFIQTSSITSPGPFQYSWHRLRTRLAEFITHARYHYETIQSRFSFSIFFIVFSYNSNSIIDRVIFSSAVTPIELQCLFDSGARIMFIKINATRILRSIRFRKFDTFRRWEGCV